MDYILFTVRHSDALKQHGMPGRVQQRSTAVPSWNVGFAAA